MRIYVDRRINVMYIEGVSSGPVTDYMPSSQGRLLSIYRPSLGVYDILNIDFTLLRDQNDMPFEDAIEAIRYLQSVSTFTPFTAIYPLDFDSETQTLTVDKYDITNGGDF